MYFIGAYVPPDDQPTVHRVEQALGRVPAGVDTLLVCDLNARLEQPQDQREEDLVTAIVNYGIVDQTLQFIPRRNYRWNGGWSCSMWGEGRLITVGGYYIIGTQGRDFYNICIREPIV